jgi:hypothetical protein
MKVKVMLRNTTSNLLWTCGCLGPRFGFKPRKIGEIQAEKNAVVSN